MLEAAGDIFAERDFDAPFEEVARRAGVGIATVHRNLPTREQLVERVYLTEVHKDSGGTYGTLRVTAELRYGRGIHVGKEQVHLLMRRLGIYGLPKRRLPRGAKVGNASSLDLVRRRFEADLPNELWQADIERHEASWNRAVMKGHRGWLVAASRCKLGAA